MFGIIATVVALLYIFFDVNYFVRLFFTIAVTRWFQKRFSLKEVTTVYGICTTQDMDYFITHMNNARFIREVDFARFHFYDRTGMYLNIKALAAKGVQGATLIRYRRMIPLFSVYKIETKLLYWKDKEIFLEHKFITVRDGFVRAIMLSRQNMINVTVGDLMKNVSGADEKLECPEEVKHWLQAIEVASARLRKRD